VGKQRQKGRWPAEQRLQFIDFRLFWEGHVNRRDIIDHFGVSVPQASADLTQYQDQAKDNAVYDKTRKTYVAGPKFRPVFFRPSADEYLAQLRMIQSGLLPEEEAWAVRLPSYSIVPILRRRLDAGVLRQVLESIRSGTAIEVSYQSFTHPEPTWRWLSPHALGFDGGRWHARAWCHTRREFRDFVLARILEVRKTGPVEADPAADRGWHEEVTLKIAPHPDLKDGKRRAIELDFGMSGGAVEITTRVCLSIYLERHLGLDLDPKLIPPERQQIVLVNRGDVEAARKKAGGC
jgi:predicted DNA-binding transcriptional regulator YafY